MLKLTIKEVYGQIFAYSGARSWSGDVQNNALSGALMLVGILLNSLQMALLAVAGNVISTLTAYISGYSREDINNGLYGFNGTLVGIAVGVFMSVTVGSLIWLVLASCLSTWIARLLGLQRFLPGFTAPFILAVWILLAVCAWMFPALLLSSGDASGEQSLAFFRAFSLNIGQVMFQGSSIGPVCSFFWEFWSIRV